MVTRKKSETSSQLRAWVVGALKDLGVSNAEVARMFGVTQQAVYGWKKTGRMDKARLRELEVRVGRRFLDDNGQKSSGVTNLVNLGRHWYDESIEHEDQFLFLFRVWQDTNQHGR